MIRGLQPARPVPEPSQHPCSCNGYSATISPYNGPQLETSTLLKYPDVLKPATSHLIGGESEEPQIKPPSAFEFCCSELILCRRQHFQHDAGLIIQKYSVFVVIIQ